MENGENDGGVCTKCRERPQRAGHRWCRVCFNEWRAEYRRARKVENACREENAAIGSPGGGGVRREDAREPQGEDAPRSGEAPPHSSVATNGNNHFAPSPHARAGARVLLTALGKNNGEAAKALMNGLARIAMGTEPNPWPILALWKHVRDTVDGLPKPAPEVKDPRMLARIILTNGPGPAPPADAAVPAESPGEHEEDGQRFVSVPPPEE